MAIDTNKVYTYTASNGTEYSYKYFEPVTRQDGRIFVGYAYAWKTTDGEEKKFTVLTHELEGYDELPDMMVERGIELHISNEDNKPSWI